MTDELVGVAARALRAFGDDLNREQAARLLDMWRYRRDLSERDVAAVLAEFPPAPLAELAVVAIWRLGLDPDKQWRVTLAHVGQHGYELVGYGQDAGTVAALAVAAGAAVIVAAVERPAEHAALSAGAARLEYCRPGRRRRFAIEPLARRMRDSGMSVASIAAVLDVSAPTVERMLGGPQSSSTQQKRARGVRSGHHSLCVCRLTGPASR